ncbi:MAG TPA: carboxylating nicotinate-nucleotide diphosphorylase [Dehalococcoidia bacterium]|nr:carboxylating nicotinate-nucleotide diphosphorylase [Dehalococcoidia bacterium]
MPATEPPPNATLIDPRLGAAPEAGTLDPALLADLARRALAEDGAFQDVTTAATVEPWQRGTGTVLAKAEGVLAGLPVMAAVFAEVDAQLAFTPLRLDGERVRRGDRIATIEGCFAAMLRGERTALNLLQRLSGVATAAARAVAAVEGLPVRIVDTRKTTPGLRALEKYAVRAGGGHNHRFNLTDGVLVKDNHLAALRSRGLGIADAVRLARQRAPHTLRVELEVTTLAELDEALAAGAEIILLDNMPAAEMAEAVRRSRGRALTEASGGITPDTARAAAETGVDLISLGALTHSAPALDISLELALAD